MTATDTTGNQGMARIVASNTLAQLVARGAGLVAGLGTNVVLSRHLGPAGFGHYSLVFAYVGLVMGIFAEWGLGTIAVRDASQQHAQTEPILTTAAIVQVLASASAYVLLLLAAHVFLGHQMQMVVAVAGLAILLMPIDLLALVLQVQLKLAYSAWVGIVGSLLTLLAAIGAVALGAGLLGIVAATTGALLLRYGLLLLVVRRRLVWQRVRPQRERFKPLVREAWPLALATIFTALINQMPVILLGKLSTGAQIGYFSAANKIAVQLPVVPLMLSTSLYPLVARLATQDTAAVRRAISVSLKYMTVLGVLIAGVGILYGSTCVTVLYGSKFEPAGPVLAVLVAQAATLYPGIIAGNTLVALGRQRVNLLILAVCTLALIPAIGLVAPQHGALGVGWALFVAHALIMVVAAYALLRHVRLRLTSRVTSLMAASTAFCIGAVFVAMKLPGNVVLGCGLVAGYLVALQLMGTIELRSIGRIISFGRLKGQGREAA